jgi:serine/threonine protein phosphatase PrpC
VGVAAARLGAGFFPKILLELEGTPEERLRAAFLLVAAQVCQALDHSAEEEDFANDHAFAAVAALVSGGKVFLGWSGDALAFHLRGGAVLAETRPHILLYKLIEEGHLSSETAEASHLKDVITQAVAISCRASRETAPALLGPWGLAPGDRLILCSRRVHQNLEPGALHRLVEAPLSQGVVERLLSHTVERGRPGDYSALVLSV